MMTLLPVVTMFILSAAVCGKEISMRVDSNVQSAVIFSGSAALIERDVKVVDGDIPVGSHTLHLQGLSASIDDDSIRLASSSDTSILDFKVSSVVVPREKSSAYLSAVSELESKLVDVRKLLSEQSKLKDRLLFRQESIKLFVTKRVSADNVDIAKGLELISSADEELGKTNKELSDIQLTLDGLSAQAAMLEKELQDVKQSPLYPMQTTEKTLTIRLQTSQAHSASAPLVVQVSYLCNPASWTPHYDLHVTSSGAAPWPSYTAHINYFAQVWQSTGEDWSNVRLGLSTSSPTAVVEGLQPPRRIVSRYTPMLYAARGGMMMAAGASVERADGGRSSRSNAMMKSASVMEMDEMAADATQSAPAMAMQPVAAPSSLGELSLDHLFTLRHPVNVTQLGGRGEGSVAHYQHMLLVDSVTFPVSVFTTVCPSMDTTARMSMLASYPKEAPPLIPSDRLRIHLQDSYVGQGVLTGATPGARLMLPLGVDKAVKVTSEAVVPQNKDVEQDRSTWLVQDKKRFRVRKEERMINVHNTHQSSEKLVLLVENLPRSTEDDFKVELLSPSKAEIQTLPSSALAALGKGQVTDASLLTDGDFMQAVLLHEVSSHTASSLGKKKTAVAYMCAASGNIYWALWLQPGEKAALSFKFTITSPEDQTPILS